MTISNIIARKSNDDDIEKILIANLINNDYKKTLFHTNAILPTELGSISIENKEPKP
jgi:hypothetical protein